MNDCATRTEGRGLKRAQHMIGSAGLAIALATPAGAQLLLYDGFPAGGTDPVGADQYVSEPASTNGSNNDAIEGQRPVLTGFSADDAWVRFEGVSANVYPRINSTGLIWSNPAGQALVTTEGAAEIFRSGDPGGSVGANNKRVERDTTVQIDGGLPDGLYVSALFHFNEAFLSATGPGTVGLRQGPSFARTHFIGFNNDGHLIAGTGATSGVSDDPFAADTTHFIVALFREDGSGRFVDLWFDPFSGLSDLSVQGTPDATFISDYVAGNSNLDQILFLQMVASMNATDTSFIFDEIRLGTTWESVTPFTVAEDPVAVIPEPSSLLLAVAGAFAVLRLRRSRR